MYKVIHSISHGNADQMTSSKTKFWTKDNYWDGDVVGFWLCFDTGEIDFGIYLTMDLVAVRPAIEDIMSGKGAEVTLKVGEHDKGADGLITVDANSIIIAVPHNNSFFYGAIAEGLKKVLFQLVLDAEQAEIEVKK